ncbi:hypothetical protein Pla52o_26910 [Novipirellula galeiformis]|uniref:Uncharacterized protein n=1 Tax=Novipirellula galeiformis TaxID=2528004 RepID=A0A5C6CIY8_9BACT|nr:hypothetical protein Pla52o_26910 [Novipirellula galeiformis]
MTSKEKGSLVSDFRLTRLGALMPRDKLGTSIFRGNLAILKQHFDRQPIFNVTHGPVVLRPAFSGGLPLSRSKADQFG